jgi:hypothetical protein
MENIQGGLHPVEILADGRTEEKEEEGAQLVF